MENRERHNIFAYFLDSATAKIRIRVTATPKTVYTYTFNAEDVYQLAKEISNIKVDKGYYYRVAGVHSVTHNGVTETNNRVTDPIDYR